MIGERRRSAGIRRWLLAGLLTAIADGLFSSVLAAFFYGSTVTRLWEGVASALGGKRPAWVGVLVHFGVAFAWAGLFVLLSSRMAWLRTANVLAVAAVYGPFVWLVMSLVVMPLIFHRPPTINIRWWIQFFGHIVFVGLPIAATRSAGVRAG